MSFLVVPVSSAAPVGKLRFHQQGRTVLDLDVRWADHHPEHHFFYPVPEGTESVSLNGVPVQAEFCRELPQPEETDRPAIHFTAPRGWINDPNGCYFQEGLWHLFYQYNPVGNDWGNMHWGHACSTDLIHWQHRPVALFPDEYGTRYSGSAIVDRDNVSGLGDGETPPVLLFYTAAGGENEVSRSQPFTQRIACSLDGGETFREYAQNPIIPEIAAGSRDPKVFPDGEGQFLLTLYVGSGEFALFRSADLLHWKKTQSLSLPGDRECPDLFPLPWGNGVKWVFMAATGYYQVGTVHDGKFYPDHPEPKIFGSSDREFYAAQTFWSDGPDRWRISWNRWLQAEQSRAPFHCSMSLPVRLSLVSVDQEPWLAAQPVDLSQVLICEEAVENTRRIEKTLSLPVQMELTGDAVGRICGVPFEASGRSFVLAGEKTELPTEMGSWKMIADRYSVEIFGAEGLLYRCRSVPEDAKPEFTCCMKGGTCIIRH